MGTDYDLVCADCNSFAGFEFNNPTALIAIWNHADKVAALASMMDELDAATGAYTNTNFQWLYNGPWFKDFIEWAGVHRDHDVRPKDEYGRWWTQCRGNVKCGECGKHAPCVLDGKHAGDCARVKPEDPT